ncbi:hypothetical protein X802_02820 [Thermococcus guaymasensis DSM 11113]|uniref:Uncharacterized protein n=1 Tax=Thermococcus guaymasensis DSM 11113 TaxID=1432656 RepID=A0A0X1KN01_9EURY|nr:hypothetical protein [Thermococcus guaymasensis]AJC72671.1 hypothetical protein X802_02820 [Thermococcus guaymasensis DSM 11113]
MSEKPEFKFEGTYVTGYPGVVEENVPCYIELYENEVVVKRRTSFSWRTGLTMASGELFRIPYEKIDSVTTDIEREWSGKRLFAGFITLGIGALLIGKKKTEQIGLIVKGRDKEGNELQIPIVFAPVKSSAKIKAALDKKISQARGIQI